MPRPSHLDFIRRYHTKCRRHGDVVLGILAHSVLIHFWFNIIPLYKVITRVAKIFCYVNITKSGGWVVCVQGTFTGRVTR
jgi:hypothetical protein